MNSVREIESECLRLINISELQSDDLETYQIVKNIKLSLVQMNTEFEKQDTDEILLKASKQVCIDYAILLESLLRLSNSEVAERYYLRERIVVIYKRLKTRLYNHGANLSKELVYFKYVESLYRISKDLIFTLNKEELELLDVIEAELDLED